MTSPHRVAFDTAAALQQQASAALQRQDAAQALQLCERALAIAPQLSPLHALRGVALRRLGRFEDADAAYARALQLAPEAAATWLNRGLLWLDGLQQPEPALRWIDEALLRDPGYFAAHFNRGNALLRLGRRDEALGAYAAARAIDPGSFEVCMSLGSCARATGRWQQALEAFADAARLRPGAAAPWQAQARVWLLQGLPERALPCLRQAVALAATDADLQHELAAVLHTLGENAQALQHLEQALALQPQHVAALNDSGVVLRALGRPGDAIERFDRALVLAPQVADLHGNRGNALRDAGRLPEAQQSYDRATAGGGGAEPWAGLALQCALELCAWDDLAERQRHIVQALQAGALPSSPFTLLACSDDPALQRLCGERAAARLPARPWPALPQARGGAETPIRVAWFSSDFGDHPVGHLLAAVFERVDRRRFAFSVFRYGHERDDAWWRRIEAAAVEVVDCTRRSDAQCASAARERGIDVAVDLNGYTRHGRLGIFALRAAPVQVGYLGYVGTTGAPFIDYLLADPVLLPPALRPHVSEQVVYLPLFQANDALQEAAPWRASPETRERHGLPSRGPLLSCLNANYKIGPSMFALWLRVLQRAGDATLWLYAPHAQAQANLRQQARRAGIDPARLHFAPAVGLHEHLRRQALADLFLDTAPYNAGATASNALRVGVPVLTLAGRTLAGRMGASLLTALGLPDLIADDAADYEAKAVALALAPARLADLRARLAAALPGTTLFDPARFTRTLERALQAMVQRQRRGEAPADIDVAALMA